MNSKRPRFTGRQNYVHCISRTIDCQFLLGEVEREAFVRLMRKVEGGRSLRELGQTISLYKNISAAQFFIDSRGHLKP